MYMTGFGVLGVGIEGLVTDTHETMNSDLQNIFSTSKMFMSYPRLCHHVMSSCPAETSSASATAPVAESHTWRYKFQGGH
jgi:hypothetical protein